MNSDPQTQEIDRIRTILARHELPEFVSGYDVRLGEFDGTPAFWIQFQIVPHADTSPEGSLQRGDDLVSLTRSLNPDFFREVENRFPFYQFAEVNQTSSRR